MVKDEISREILKYFELNENVTHQNLWDVKKQCLEENLSIECIY